MAEAQPSKNVEVMPTVGVTFRSLTLLKKVNSASLRGIL